MPMTQFHKQSPSEPLETLQNPLLAKLKQGNNNSAVRINSYTLGHPNLPPVAGASTKVQERVLGATANSTILRGLSPHPSLSEQPDQSTLMNPGYSAKGREGTLTGTPVEAAENPHVGDTQSSHTSSKSAGGTWQKWLASKVNGD